MDEVWKDIKTAEGYQVSNLGRVRSLDRKKISKKKKKDGTFAVYNLKGKLMKLYKGEYYSVELGHRTCGVTIHRLMANAFIPNPKNKKCINHIDGNKHNNSLLNLEWCTYSENTKHAINIGLKLNRNEDHSQFTLMDVEVADIRNRYKKGETQASISKIFGIDPSTVSRIVNNKTRI